MPDREPRKYVVFWLAHFVGNPRNKGWGTELIHPRFKDFDDPKKALEHVEKLTKCQADGVPYQSRLVSHITMPKLD